MRILVTGGSGFLGQALLARLRTDPACEVRSAVRRPGPSGLPGQVLVGNLASDTDWGQALEGVDVVVHAAARVHVMQETALDPLAEFRRVNVEGTLSLARQAAGAGVKRFIFISSIKVNGEGTAPGRPYTADDRPAPTDPYGISKHEAEQGLTQLAGAAGIEVVIIRPVLVYGPGVGANFLAMVRWLHRGIPLPLGALDNRRSLVAVENLSDLIARCLDHPAAANQTFLVSDGEDLSTTALLRRTATALGTRARLFPVPAAALGMGARLLGRGQVAQRLCGSLQVDIGKTRRLLGWSPPLGVDEALERMARGFLAEVAGPRPRR
jgi:nucleoside-diphosphate-sugar epimerase